MNRSGILGAFGRNVAGAQFGQCRHRLLAKRRSLRGGSDSRNRNFGTAASDDSMSKKQRHRMPLQIVGYMLRDDASFDPRLVGVGRKRLARDEVAVPFDRQAKRPTDRRDFGQADVTDLGIAQA